MTDSRPSPFLTCSSGVLNLGNFEQGYDILVEVGHVPSVCPD